MNVYRRILRGARQAPDGETPTEIEVVRRTTEDGRATYSVEHSSYDTGHCVLIDGLQRDMAITAAARLTEDEITELARARGAYLVAVGRVLERMRAAP